MPMRVYMNVNEIRVQLPNPTDEYPRYTLELKVGNGADVLAELYPSDLDKLVKALVVARESNIRRKRL